MPFRPENTAGSPDRHRSCSRLYAIEGLPGRGIQHAAVACVFAHLADVGIWAPQGRQVAPAFFGGALDKKRYRRSAPRPGGGWSRAMEEHIETFSSSCKNLSVAPRANVVAVTAFYNGDSENIRGTMLTYTNGSRRTVGQCGVRIDRTKTFERPDGLCFQEYRNVSRCKRSCLQRVGERVRMEPMCARCKEDPSYHGDNTASKCVEALMSGELIFQFSLEDDVSCKILGCRRPDRGRKGPRGKGVSRRPPEKQEEGLKVKAADRRRSFLHDSFARFRDVLRSAFGLYAPRGYLAGYEMLSQFPTRK